MRMYRDSVMVTKTFDNSQMWTVVWCEFPCAMPSFDRHPAFNTAVAYPPASLFPSLAAFRNAYDMWLLRLWIRQTLGSFIPDCPANKELNVRAFVGKLAASAHEAGADVWRQKSAPHYHDVGRTLVRLGGY